MNDPALEELPMPSAATRTAGLAVAAPSRAPEQDEDGPADEPWWPGAKDNKAIVHCSNCYNYLVKYRRDRTFWTINRWCEARDKRNVQVRACAVQGG